MANLLHSAFKSAFFISLLCNGKPHRVIIRASPSNIGASFPATATTANTTSSTDSTTRNHCCAASYNLKNIFLRSKIYCLGFKNTSMQQKNVFTSWELVQGLGLWIKCIFTWSRVRVKGLLWFMYCWANNNSLKSIQTNSEIINTS